tara:strand:+ start:375 stop:560 length:186 start_codon:yes stop_codon:yes gene_type:complete
MGQGSYARDVAGAFGRCGDYGEGGFALIKLLSCIISITISASTFAISLPCISEELDRGDIN